MGRRGLRCTDGCFLLMYDRKPQNSVKQLSFNKNKKKNNLTAMQKTQVLSLGWEDPLEKEMATPPVFLPGKSHGQRNVAGCSPWGHKRVGHA